MVRKVVWSEEAVDDLEALAEYIARDSEYYAAAFVQEILDDSSSLDELSERGRIVPEIADPNIREIFVREYRILYSVEESRVAVLGIIHGKRDLKRLWETDTRH